MIKQVKTLTSNVRKIKNKWYYIIENETANTNLGKTSEYLSGNKKSSCSGAFFIASFTEISAKNTRINVSRTV